MLTCQEIIDYLSAYVAGELPPEEQAAMDRHLAVCPACVNFLDSFRTTLAVSRSTNRFARADSIPESLVQAVLKARNQSGP
jgi:anti-sigma factor RsiW